MEYKDVVAKYQFDKLYSELSEVQKSKIAKDIEECEKNPNT